MRYISPFNNHVFTDEEHEVDFWRISDRPPKDKTPLWYTKRFLSETYCKRVLDREFERKKPVIIKVINRGFGVGHLSKLMNYIARENEYQKTSGMEEVCLYDRFGDPISADDFKTIAQDWQKSFHQESAADKQKYSELNKLSVECDMLKTRMKDGLLTDEEHQRLQVLKNDKNLQAYKNKRHKDFTHILFSPGGKPDKERAMQAMQGFLNEHLLSDGYDYIWGYHQDTENHHFHVIVKNQNKCKNRRKFSLDKFDLYALRERFAHVLEQYGIDRTTTGKFDRKANLEEIKKQPERIYKSLDYIERRMQKYDPDKSKGFDVFAVRKNARKSILNFERSLEFKSNLNGLGPRKTKALKKTLKQVKKEFETVYPENFRRMRTVWYLELGQLDKKIGDSFQEALCLEKTEPSAKRDIADALIRKRERMIDNAFDELSSMLQENDKNIDLLYLYRELTALRKHSKYKEKDKDKGSDNGRGMGL